MLVETLLVIPLAGRALPGPAPTWSEGIANWLLEGAWTVPLREPELGAGGVVARLHRVAKALDPAAKVTASDGALEPFESVGPAEPGAGLESVPPAWTTGLVDGTAHVVLTWEGLLATITARHATRTRGDVPALRLVLRAVRTDLLPEEGEDPSYDEALGRALAERGAFRNLRDGLARDGERLAAAVAGGLADLAVGPTETRTRVRVFERTDGLEEVVRGLPATARRHLAVVGRWFLVRRPMVEVLRRRKDGGVELWRGDGDTHAG